MESLCWILIGAALGALAAKTIAWPGETTAVGKTRPPTPTAPPQNDEDRKRELTAAREQQNLLRYCGEEQNKIDPNALLTGERNGLF